MTETSELEMEGIKLEYGFVAGHLRDLVRIRFVYLGIYLAAIGAVYGREPVSFQLHIIFALITAVVWLIELRTRVIIRASTKRLTEIERKFFGYEGFFAQNHPLHRKDGVHDPNHGTTPGIKESIIVFWPFPAFGPLKRIEPARLGTQLFKSISLSPGNRLLGYSAVMDLLFGSMVVLSIVQLFS